MQFLQTLRQQGKDDFQKGAQSDRQEDKIHKHGLAESTGIWVRSTLLPSGNKAK